MNINIYAGNKVKIKTRTHKNRELVYIGPSPDNDTNCYLYSNSGDGLVCNLQKKDITHILIEEKFEFAALNENEERISGIGFYSKYATNKKIEVLAKAFQRMYQECSIKNQKIKTIKSKINPAKWYKIGENDSVEFWG